MNGDNSSIDHMRGGDESEWVSEPLWRRYLWPLAGLAALLVFELTASIACSSFVLCIKFGIGDFFYARWLQKHDPVHSRRHACVLMQLALGAFKIVMTGTILSLIFLVVASTQRQNQNHFGQAAIITSITALIGFMISSWLSLQGAFVADKAKLKVWVDRSMGHKALVEFPPQDLGTINEVASLMDAMLLATTIFLIVAIVSIFLCLPMIPVPVVIFVLLFSGGYVCYVMNCLKHRILAKTLEECWPELCEHNAIASAILTPPID